MSERNRNNNLGREVKYRFSASCIHVSRRQHTSASAL